MKLSRRVLVIARHFWPTTQDDTLRLTDWIEHLQQEGAEVSVATPRWHKSWPHHIVSNGVTVQRIDYPPTHPLRAGRYLRQLGNWIAQSRDGFDLIYCDQPDLEALAVLDYVPRAQSIPLVVRVVGTPAGREIDICRRASLVVVPNLFTQQQVLAAGICRTSVVRAVQSIGTCYDRSNEARRRARQILADANHDLFVRSQDRVVVCPGELARHWGVDVLIHAIMPLMERHRALRVWILGDSRERTSLYEMLRQEGLHRLVIMPGMFTDLEAVLQAADLCVFPAKDKGLGWLVPTCIASGLPFMVSDSPAARYCLGQQADKLTFHPDSAVALRDCLTAWLRDANPCEAGVAELRRHNATTALSMLGYGEMFQSLEASA